MTSYVFDVDGTMTPSRQTIKKHFASWFEHFATHHAVYFVTGSDRPKTTSQLGQQIYNLAHRVYQCNGNDVWEQGTNVRTGMMILPIEVEKALNKAIVRSKFLKSMRNGNHIELRSGMANLSFPGHGCTMENRYNFKQFDEATGERQQVADRLSEQFPQYSFQVAGETGIDIIVKGTDKSQILKDFEDEEEILFFGDKCKPGGNDYEIARAVSNRSAGRVFEVEGWEDTWNHLKQLG